MEAQGQFDPVFFANLEWQKKNDLTGGQIFNGFNGNPTFTGFVNEADIGTFQVGLQQNLQSGGQVQLQYQNTYNWNSPQQTQLNPFYQTNLSLQLTQPLLKNFGYDVNQAADCHQPAEPERELAGVPQGGGAERFGHREGVLAARAGGAGHPNPKGFG